MLLIAKIQTVTPVVVNFESFNNVQAPKGHHDRAPYILYFFLTQPPRYIVDKQLRVRCLPAVALEPAGMINGTFRTACRPLNVKWRARDIRQTGIYARRGRDPPQRHPATTLVRTQASRRLALFGLPGYVACTAARRHIASSYYSITRCFYRRDEIGDGTASSNTQRGIINDRACRRYH